MKQVKRKKLALDKITIAALSVKELSHVAGGALPATRQTHCGTECEATNFCG
jgi:natural product precursor